MKRNGHQSGRRTKSGQAMAEGAVALALLTLLGMGTLLLLVDCFFTIYWRGKVQFVGLKAAQYLADLPTNVDGPGLTTTYVNNLLSQLGMSASAPPHCDRQRNFAAVQVFANPPALMSGSGIFLPVIGGPLHAQEISSPQTGNAVGYLQLEWERADWIRIHNGGEGGSPPEPSNPAYLPIITRSQVDPTKRLWMIDTSYWPATHVVYHAAYADMHNYRYGPGHQFIQPGGNTMTQTIETYMQQFYSQNPNAFSPPFPPSVSQPIIDQCLAHNNPAPPAGPCGGGGWIKAWDTIQDPGAYPPVTPNAINPISTTGNGWPSTLGNRSW